MVLQASDALCSPYCLKSLVADLYETGVLRDQAKRLDAMRGMLRRRNEKRWGGPIVTLRRDHIIADVVAKQPDLSDVINAQPIVSFEGEGGIDAGGVTKVQGRRVSSGVAT